MAVAEEAFVIEAETAVRYDVDFARRSDAYLSRALGLACYILGDVHEAEDATQEAMARAWKARRSLRRLESFDAWLDRIVVNSCRERIRRRRSIREISLPLDAEPEAIDGFGALLARDSVGRALAAHEGYSLAHLP